MLEVVRPDQVVPERLDEHPLIGCHALALGTPQRDRDLPPLALVASPVRVDRPDRRDERARCVALGAAQDDARAESVAEIVGGPAADALGSAEWTEVQLRPLASEHSSNVARAVAAKIIPFVRGAAPQEQVVA